jgi:integral membrane protein (TIGR01906 family)
MNKILRLLIPLLFLIATLLTFVRLLLTPVFIQIEYRRPGFPPDPYGFTLADRLEYAEVSRAYLLTNAGAEYFASYRLASGAPLYSDQEISHLTDVQKLVAQSLVIWEISAVLLLVCFAYLLWKDKSAFWQALYEAGRFVFLLIVCAGVAVMLFWDSAFVTFHEIFFAGNWLFRYSDSLIRLFPVEFWQDIFLSAAGGTLLVGLAAMLIARRRYP